MFPKPPFQLNIAAVDTYLASASAGVAKPWIYPPANGNPSNALYGLLANIQGNILQPHGRPFAKLMFFRYSDTSVTGLPGIKAYLGKASGLVTNALQQYSDTWHRDHNKGLVPVRSLMLSRWGVKLAGRNPPDEGIGGNSFSAGMLRKGAFLGDPVDGDDRPTTWEEFYLNEGELHGMWLVAHKTRDGLSDACAKIVEEADRALTFIHSEDAVTVRDKEGFAREPFGFRDGISMPKFFMHVPHREGLANPPLEQILLPTGQADSCSSFMVFRKLQQHVTEFLEFEGQLSEALKEKGMDERDASRLLVGRSRDGTPLVRGMHEPHLGEDPEQMNFSFGNDMKAGTCPFHAHIRKAFARQPQEPGGPPPGEQLEAQFIRRGMLFGVKPEITDRPKCEKVAGLLFMSYMSNIGSQFEKLQADWFKDLQVPIPGVNQFDPVIFGQNTPGGMWSWPERNIGPLPIGRFVTPLGGSYLFVPSRTWLQEIVVADGNTG